jgi:thioredoxin reductase (NADPH)
MAGIEINKDKEHDWKKMVVSVQKHIKSLNWGYKTELIKLKVKYYNAYASFLDAHTI